MCQLLETLDDLAPGAQEALKDTILVVDDDASNIAYCTTCLKRFGFKFETARHGGEAIALFKAHPERFSLILMDLQMPNCTGEEAFWTIRGLDAFGAAIPIVAVTAHALDQSRERCLSMGMADYLTKPYRPKELKALVERWT